HRPHSAPEPSVVLRSGRIFSNKTRIWQKANELTPKSWTLNPTFGVFSWRNMTGFYSLRD
ncbi:MAG TPA: hypothetical protein VGM52_17855, partial [Herbaspirillum sp.]